MMKGKKITTLLLISGLIFIPSCKEALKKMAVNTGTYSNVLTTTAVVSGTIIDLGQGANKYGHCYSTTANPTVDGTRKEMSNPALGDFTSTLSGLIPGTTYYVKAYLGRGNEVVYGSEINFKTAPLTTPGAPIIGAATGGNALATVTFTAPVSDGGSAITGYTVTSSPGGLTGTGTASPVTVLGLTNGTAYTFTVTASNANGTGPSSSASNAVTPLTVPGAPIIGTATAGNSQATVIFAAPASDGGSAITGYTVTSSPSGFIGTGSSSPITVTGLTNGTAYTFTVVASNINGNSTASSVSNSVTPSTIPGSPTGVSATAGYERAAITFTAPASNGGSAITGYTVTSSPGGMTGTGSASPITITGLTYGIAFTFTVTASNANGTSPASSASNAVTPFTVPGAPAIGIATAGNAQATVIFSAPVSNGGSAITGYTVTSSPGALTGYGTASPIAVSGLTNGTTYSFTVTATNAAGAGLASSASNSVTPSTVPGAPIIGIATKGDTQVRVTFTAPVSNGGSAITGYTVISSPGSLTGSGATSPIRVTGLTNGTLYTFTVTAMNINGTSPASGFSNSVTPAVIPQVTNPTTGKIWMDRNLGASQVATSSTDAASYGDLYQWGRAADGHQIKTSGTTSSLSNTDNPGNPNFILAPNSPYDWRSPQNINLWQGENGINNPCPCGFRIPTETELDAERATWSSQNVAGAYASPLKLPAAGYRLSNTGALQNVNASGAYWSNNVVNIPDSHPRWLDFGNSNAYMTYGNSAIGGSVRCIKD